MRKILFVDDEANILHALQRMLRPMRHEWEVSVAESGCEALERLDRGSCDVVVTDMRMPSMSGAQLLNEISHRHPHTVRIILSGQSDLVNALAAIGCAHQYMSKPTESELLVSTLSRIFRLIDLVPNPLLRRKLNGLQSLPSCPEAYARLVELVRSPTCTSDSLASTIAFDMGMAAKTLQIANSAFIDSPCRDADVFRAVQMLGPELIRALFLQTEVYTPVIISGGPEYATAITQLLQEAMGSARQARSNVILDSAGANRACALALLANVGQLALSVVKSNDRHCATQEGIDRSEGNGSPQAIDFEVNHPKVGAYLMGLWGLPESLSDGILNHSSAKIIPSSPHSLTLTSPQFSTLENAA